MYNGGDEPSVILPYVFFCQHDDVGGILYFLSRPNAVEGIAPLPGRQNVLLNWET